MTMSMVQRGCEHILEVLATGQQQASQTVEQLNDIPEALREFRQTVENVQTVVAIYFDRPDIYLIVSMNLPNDPETFQPETVHYWSCNEQFDNSEFFLGTVSSNLYRVDVRLPQNLEWDRFGEQSIQNRCIRAITLQ